MDDFASFRSGKENKSGEELLREAQAVASRYKGKSDGDIMKAIYAQAVEGKRNGTLTNEQIDAFYRQFSPMLDGAQRKKLQKVIEQLKKM